MESTKKQNNFQIVQMYKCKWCEKIFRSTRHKCMYNPKNKNCFSCKHCTWFDRFEGQYGEYGRCEIEPYKEFVCDLDETVDTGYADFYGLVDRKWLGNCPYWKLRDGYSGKSTYSEIIKKYLRGLYEKENKLV